ncbi:MAG TPA: EAL domain-containing protein [Longimicrobiaceae bacterium]|nr:EAL domain-containing protein [Longimicrobiaceae bacterium]
MLAAAAAWRPSPILLAAAGSALFAGAGVWLLAAASPADDPAPRHASLLLALLALAGTACGLLLPPEMAGAASSAAVAVGLAAAAWTAVGARAGDGRWTRRALVAVLAAAALVEAAPVALAPSFLGPLALAALVLQGAVAVALAAALVDEAQARTADALAEVERLAYHDTSTNLPNRRLLVDRIDLEIARVRRTGGRFAIAHLDVDRFKDVNEAWSPAVGDAVLRGMGDRLRGVLRDGDVLSRLGSDSFALLFSGVTTDEQVTALTDRVARRIGRPFVLHEREIELTASIGVSMYPEHGGDAEQLLRNADAAMSRAKEAGRNRTLFYHHDMTTRAGERLALEQALRRALAGDELVLHYQPILELATGRVVRFEALLRWPHPQRGMLSPDEFLSLIEPMGLTEALDQWVLRTACSEALHWRHLAQGRAPQVAVNLSARSLQQPDLVRRIDTVLSDTGLPASALELEITESAAMEHAESTLRTLRELKELGVHIAIDDFGTGYSSLSYLRTFPIDTIKIDRAFVRDLGVHPNATALIAGITALARSLGLSVVAEGLETEKQRDILQAQRCEYVQGYFFGRPMAPAACLTWLAAHRGRQSDAPVLSDAAPPESSAPPHGPSASAALIAIPGITRGP